MRLLRAWIERMVEMEGIDRAVVLAAQAFSALFPLLIVYASLFSPGGGSRFAERLIARFEISGASAETLRGAFAPPESAEGTITVVSVVLVVVSALTFARAMQRLYERAWAVPPLGLRATGWNLLWLGGLVLLMTARGVADDELSGMADVVVSLAYSTALWLATPFVLLARRESWRRLLPGAVVTALAMLGFSVVLVIAGPLSFESSANAYGLMGVAFAIVGWLVGAGIVLMASSALGAVIAVRLIPRG